MKSLIDFLMQRNVLWIIAVLLAFPLLYLQDFFGGEDRPNCKPAPVPPRVNADGTVDHVLISKCEGSKGHYIRLRFAADHKVNASENMEPTEVGGFGGPTVTLSSSTNRYVVAHYDMSNGWKPVSNREYENLDKNSVAEIMFSRWGNNLNQTSLERDAKDIETACEAPIRHPNGLFEYRLKKGRDPRAYPRCFGTYLDPRNPRTYVSLNPVAVFDCWEPNKDGGSTGACTGSVDTPEPVHININFSNTTEPTPEQIAYLIPHVLEQVRRAFVDNGELQQGHTFNFENTKGGTS